VYYYQHHIGDFIKDTANLTDAQCMAYMRMLWVYYTDEKPLLDDCESIAFAVRSDEKTVRQLLKHYFVLTDEGWRHKRCDQEIQEFHAKSEKAKASANARWKNANAMRTHTERNANDCVFVANQEPITNNQTNTPPKPPKGEAFDLPSWLATDAWSGFVDMRRRIKKPMNDRAKKLIVAALEKMREKGIDIDAVLDNSTRNNWRDVYEPKHSATQIVGSPKFGSDEYFEFHRNQTWWSEAGFESVWDAVNNRCNHKNYAQFRDGKRLEAE